MISVRKEWEAAETDTDKLEWAKKWGDLLMETYQNPMWTSGHTQGTKEILALLANIRKGNVPEVPLPHELQQYIVDMETLAKSIKTISFSIKVEEEVLPNLDEDKLKQVACTQVSEGIYPFIEVDINELESGMVEFNYSIAVIL